MELFGCGLVVHVGEGQAVAEPFHSKIGDKSRLADTLRTIQHGHIIELYARLVYPLISGAEGFPRHGSDIGIVRCSQIINKERIYTGDAVPRRQSVEILTDRVIAAVVHGLGDGDGVIPRRECAVVIVHVADKLGIVRIPPKAARMFPRDFALDFHVVRQLVEHDVLHIGVVLHNQLDVVEGVLKHSGFLLVHQFGFPVLRELLGGSLLPLLQGKLAYLLVLGGKLHHGMKVAFKEMRPYQVKTVHQFSVSRVGGMVAVGKLLIVDDNAGNADGAFEAPPILILGFLIHIGEEITHDFLHGSCAAKRSDDTILGQRVLLFFASLLRGGSFGRGSREFGTVLPIGVSREKHIGVKPCAVIFLADILPVRRAGRPVHQLVNLEGTGINLLHADAIGKITGDGVIFVRGHIPCQRNEDSRPWCLRHMTVSGVDDGKIAGIEFIEELRLQLVAINGYHGAALHIGLLAADSFELACQETALVLDRILLVLLHLPILLDGFGSPDWCLEPFFKFTCGHFFRMPHRRLAAVSEAKVEFPHADTSSHFVVK